MNPVSLIIDAASKNPDTIAIIDHHTAATYRELIDDVRRLSAHLRRSGVGNGDRIAQVFNAGDYQDIVCVLALAYVGATACSIHESFLAQYQIPLRDAGFFKIAAFSPSAREIAQAIPDTEYVELIDWRSCGADQAPDITHDFEMRVQFSSGTTGSPKAVLFEDASVHEKVSRAMRRFDLLDKERIAILFSLMVGPGIYARLAALASGAALIACDIQNEVFWDFMETYQPTYMYAPTAVLNMIFSEEGSPRCVGSVRKVVFAGSRLSPVIFERISNCLDCEIISGFGATEIGTIAQRTLSLADARAGVIGYAQPGIDVEVVDELGRSLPPNHEGLLRVRRSGMASGYLNNQKASENVFRDGWFYTGDVASIADDGLIRIIGRRGDIINYGGAKYSLNDFDDIASGVSGIIAAAAFAFSAPELDDEPWVAAVVADDFDPEALFDAFNQRGLPLGGYWPVREIPKQNGKIARRLLSQAFAEMREARDGQRMTLPDGRVIRAKFRS